MPNDHSLAGTSVRSEHGVGVVRFVRDGQAITEFAGGVYPIPVSRFRPNPEASVTGALVLDALRIYKPLTLRLERGDLLTAQEQEAYRCALKVLEIPPAATDGYAANQRRIRAAQPRRTSEEAHAQARRVLAAAQAQTAEVDQ